jgi:hypothetical protein
VKAYPTQEQIRSAFSYDENTGAFVRLKDGNVVGTKLPTGYVTVWFAGKHYMAHVLAWIYVNGSRPEVVDHANLDRADNRLANLRAATRSLNRANSRSNKNARFPKGVRKDPRCNERYAAVLSVNGKATHLGMFGSVEDAHAAYCAAARQRFGEFARV